MAPPTSIDPRSQPYARSRQAMQELLDELRARHEHVLGTGTEVVALPGRRLAPRARIDLLLDRDAPFLELDALAGWGGPDRLGGALVLGVGLVEGVVCLVLADDAGAAGSGSPTSPTAAVKSHHGYELARRNRLPLLRLLDHAIDHEDHDRAALDAAGVPNVTVVFDPDPDAGPVAALGLGHRVVVAAGPVADEVATDDADALRLARQVVRNLNWPTPVPPPHPPAGPALDPDELLGLTPDDPVAFLDVREVLWRIVDGSRLDEVEATTAVGLVAGWASVCGFPVGIVATNGAVGPDESAKAARLVQRAEGRDLPVVFVQTRALDPGHALVQAVATAKAPHLSVLIGPPHDTTMRSGAFDPRFSFSWPSHRITPGGPAGLGDDTVIDPRDTRLVLGIALSCIRAGS